MASQGNGQANKQPSESGGKDNLALPASLRFVSEATGVIAILVGGFVLLGWTLDIEVLKRVLPGLVAMNPATAVAFVLAGAALLLFLPTDAEDRGLGRVGRGLALPVALIGLLKLTGLLSGWDPGVDQLLFAQKLEAEATVSGVPNRMAPNTALNFILIGSGLLLLDRRTRRGNYWIAQYLVLAAGASSLLTVLGYAYGVGSFSGVAAHIPMALHTALAFLVLVVGSLCARPERGLVALLRSDNMGGVVTRRLLPAAVLVPAVLGWLRLQGELAGLYDTEVGVALMVVVSIVILAAVVGLSARLLHRIDTERKRVEEALRKSEARTRAIVDTASDAIVTMVENGSIRSFNRAAERLFGYGAEEAVGQPLRILMPERLRTLHEVGFRRYLETGEARVVGKGPVELAGLRKNGEEFPLELSLGVVDEEEAEVLFTGIVRDITERKRAEEKIRHLNETLEERVAQRTAQLAERERQLEDLVGKLVTSQEEERRRVAYEIHDGLTQTAFATHQHLQAFATYHPPSSEGGQEELKRVVELAKQTVREARHVIADLRPVELDRLGLAAALRRQAEKLDAEGWQVAYEENLGDERLPSTLETALYRVAQQALTNAKKHAGTNKVHLALKRLGGREVRLRVRDWGCGFDPVGSTSDENGPGERVGLASMRERVALLGGEFEVHSKPGAGTLVVAKARSKGRERKDEIDD